jgi:hypothetical protein
MFNTGDDEVVSQMFSGVPHRRSLRVRIFAATLAALIVFSQQRVLARPQFSLSGSGVDTSACGLKNTFLDLHQHINDIAEDARDAGAQALHLKRTARRHPYRHIESAWTRVRGNAEAALEMVGRLPLLLDTVDEDEAKSAALDLAAADQKALENIIDYGHAVVFYERTENNASIIFAKQVTAFTFGMGRSKGRSFVDSAAHQFLDWRYTEIADSKRSLKIPEYRYGKLCYALTSRPVIRVGSACALEHRFADVHAVIMRLNREAVEAADTAERLHRTSFWRPYKRVEHGWHDVAARTEPTLELLSNMDVALDDVRDGEKKRAAEMLLAAYHGALLHILNYAHWAVYDERVENMASANLRPTSPTFGQIHDPTKASQVIFGRLMLDARLTSPRNVVFMVRTPEYRYAAVCGKGATENASAGGDPCKLTGRFMILRTEIGALGKASKEMGEDALRLHHTSLRRPYKRIEHAWSHIADGSAPVMRELSDLIFALDAAPGGEKKNAALNLASTYQASIERIIDYATYAVGYQRAENAVSANFTPSYFNYGVTLTSTAGIRDTIQRGFFEARHTENANAFRAMKLPEHHYLMLCDAPIPEPLLAQARYP